MQLILSTERSAPETSTKYLSRNFVSKCLFAKTNQRKLLGRKLHEKFKVFAYWYGISGIIFNLYRTFMFTACLVGVE